MKKRRRVLVLVIAAGLVVVGAGWVWVLVRSAPSWYSPADAGDAEAAALAERAEYRLVEEYHRIRGEGEQWTVRVREEQINAWLAARLPEWIANREGLSWPEGVGVPQVHIEEAGINVAVEAEYTGRKQVVVMRVVPEVREGELWARMDRVGLGRVSVAGSPAEALAGLIEEAGSEGAMGEEVMEELLKMVSGERGVEWSVELADDRRVELVDVVLSEGAIDVTNRTVRGGK